MLYNNCSINLNCCINTREYLILTIKENCQMENYGKFGKKLLLQNCFLFIDILAFKLSKLCSGVGTLFLKSFFGPRGQSFALKSSPWGVDFDRKILAREGMATGQIDT